MYVNQQSVLAFFIVCSLCDARGGDPGEWPQFRGAGAAGVADLRDLSTTWDVSTGENIRWKTEIPGLGHASPIVSHGCLFIVSASSGEPDEELRVGLYGDIASVTDFRSQTWTLSCLAADTGRICWQKTVCEGVPQIKRHTKATHANATPATDGRHVVVQLGAEGLYCFDFCGRLLWEKHSAPLDSGYYRVPEAQWGFASSPVILRNTVFVQCDVQEESHLAAYEISCGRELWRVSRDDVPSWSTPTVYDDGRQPVLIVNGYRHSGGYDVRTGKEVWRVGGGGDIPVPAPVVAHNLIYLSSAHGSDAPLRAIRTDAVGELPSSAKDAVGHPHIAWHHAREATYMQTPIVYGAHLYVCRNNGVMSCFDAVTGERLYRQRLGGGASGFTASPVAGDGKLFFTSETGSVFVVKAGTEFEQLAANTMDEICMATPAIADGTLFIRGRKHVFAVAEQKQTAEAHPSGSRTIVPRSALRSSARRTERNLFQWLLWR